MKHLLHIIFAATLLLTAGCAADRSPRSLAKHFYKSIANGEYDDALSHTTLTSDIDLELYHAIMNKVSTSIEAKGGVKKIEIVSEELSEDEQSAVVEVAITYANGTTETEYCDVIFKDEKWVVDVALYSK